MLGNHILCRQSNTKTNCLPRKTNVYECVELEKKKELDFQPNSSPTASGIIFQRLTWLFPSSSSGLANHPRMPLLTILPIYLWINGFTSYTVISLSIVCMTIGDNTRKPFLFGFPWPIAVWFYLYCSLPYTVISLSVAWEHSQSAFNHQTAIGIWS